MSIKTILTEPNSILRQISKPVEHVGQEEQKLMDDMIETMYAAPGIGLAAIQIGVPKRIIVMDISRERENKNPLYFDETFARSTVYGTIVAPYMYLRSLRPLRFDPEFPEPFSHILDAGSKFNFFFPIKIGDSISVVKKLVDIFEKDGRMGKMLFRKIEITYSNQINQQ